jgi:predicted transcriptional regulator
MSSLTVRISRDAHKALTELAQKSGGSMQAILDKAIEQYRRQSFLEGLAADFAALRANPQAWAEELAEREIWDNALMDGLEDDPPADSVVTKRSRRRRPKKKR